MYSNPVPPPSNPMHPAGPQSPPGETTILLSAVTLPAELLFQRVLTPSVVFTYAQLQALALDLSPDGAWRTACLSLEQLCALTGKRPAALYNHLRLLKVAGMLDWQAYPGQGLVIRILQPSDQADGIKTSDPAHAPRPASTASPRRLPAASTDPEEISSPPADPPFHENRNAPALSLKTSSKKERQIMRRRESRARGEKKSTASRRDVASRGDIAPRGDVTSRGDVACYVSTKNIPTTTTTTTNMDAVQIYRDLARLTPNAQQCGLLHRQVHDLPLWRYTLEHWLAHGWNPRNMPGMLELYSRGGPEGCRYCVPSVSPAVPSLTVDENPGNNYISQPQGKPGRNSSLKAIRQVRRLLKKQPDLSSAPSIPTPPEYELDLCDNPDREDRDG